MTRRLHVCIALSMVAALTGCGARPEQRVEALDRAARAAEAAGGYRAKLFLQADLQGQRLSFTGDLVSTADAGRSRVSGSLEQGEAKAFELTGISVGGQEWVRASNQKLPRGRTWTRSESGTGTPATLTPAEFAHFMLGTGQVEDVGSDRIRGRAARHYRARLDPGRLSEAAARRVAAIAGPGGPEVSLEVWLGSDGLPIRTTLHVRPPAGVGGSVIITADISGYGVSTAAIRPPPARLVAAAGG